MPTPTSQGSTVSWGGTPLGLITAVRVTPATAHFEEVTNVESTVWGVGGNARTVREFDCVSVEPGTIDVSVYGAPTYAVDETGEKKELVVTLSNGSISGEAFLESFEVSASVGEFLVGSARFRFSGSDAVS